jgi:quinol-cytochrome oxidoreductase complex cytochrome b subunit
MTALRRGLALSGWAALAAVAFLPDGGVLRLVVTTVFLLVCPGLAASRWARSAPARATDRTAVLETGVLTVVLSMSLAVLAVEPMFLSDTFTVTRALLALAVATSVLALLPKPGGRRRRAPRAVPGASPRTAAFDQAEPPASE